MADTKLSALAAATPALGDLAYIVDVSDATDDVAGSSRKTTLQSAFDALGVPYSNGGASIVENGDGSISVTTAPGKKLSVSSAGSTGAVILLNDTSGAHQACRFQFQRNGTFKWQLGTDVNSNDLDNFFVFDQATGSTRVLITSGGNAELDGGHLVITTDNTYDVGASGATRPRSIYLGTSLELEAQAWVRNHPGRKRLTANATNATAALSSGVLSDLTVTLVAGRKYTGLMAVRCSDSTAADGIQFDFNAGTATMTGFNAALVGNAQGATPGTTVSAALATALSFTAMNGTGDHWLLFAVSLVCNAGGTFIPRVAQNAHSTGTATAALGSWLALDDSPN